MEREAAQAAREAAAMRMRRQADLPEPGTSRMGDLAEFLAPQEPWEYAMMAAGPGARLASKIPAAARAAAIGLGIAGTSSEAEARKGKVLGEIGNALFDPFRTYGNWVLKHSQEEGVDPRIVDAAKGHHGFSSSRTGKPVEEMDFRVSGAPKINPRVLDISELEGKELLFGVSDRTRGGGKLTHIGGAKLDSPVAMEGGVNYPWLHADKPIPGMPEAQRLFANAPGAATKIIAEAKAIREAGRDPVFAGMNMAKISSDSSKQLAQSAYQATRQAEPSVDIIKAIDDSMGLRMKEHTKGKPSEPYPGFGSKELPGWLDQVSGPYRGAFVKALDLAQFRKAGLPDMGEVRYANTDPRLVNTPTGSVGMVMGEMAPELGTIDKSLHSTYPSAFLAPKGGVGRLQGSVPFNVIAPDIHDALLKRGPTDLFADQPAYYVMQSMPAGVPKTQQVTPRVVDQVSEFFRKYPQGWSIAGGAPVMGSLAAQDQYPK
jgi:hypothetical protein